MNADHMLLKVFAEDVYKEQTNEISYLFCDYFFHISLALFHSHTTEFAPVCMNDSFTVSTLTIYIFIR